MNYITVTNKLGHTHKLWVVKENNSFTCYRTDCIDIKPDPEFEDVTSSKEYKIWPQKKFESREAAENSLLKYVDAGIKAGIFKNKNIF